MSHGYRTIKIDGVSISLGNTKMGETPSVSLTPCRTCPASAPCRKDCYAFKAYRMFPSVRAAWDENTRIAELDLSRFMDAVRKYLDDYKPRFFRWHVAGDIPSPPYYTQMRALARAFPETHFLCFTKRYGYVLGTPRESNLQVVFSMWPGYGPTRRNRFPRAWMQDGTETRVPATALECPGNCESCGMCWHLDQIGRDVVFHKH